MNNKRLLIIDDDRELTELLTEYLGGEGFEVECCHDGVTGLSRAYDKGIDLILLDVMMPQLNGFEVLKALGGNHQTPVLMLTAKGDDTDRVLGLELGADDYLAKPFHHRELLARIKAILRRIDIIRESHEPVALLKVNEVELHHATRQVFCHGQTLELTGTEYQILTYLMEHHGTIVSKESLSELVLGRKLSPFDRSIDMHVSNIRRKLLPASDLDKIKTIRGAGYIFLSGESLA
ncbi:response regulator [Thalassomonas haliotis]|uniref:Response regulator n=1 Tax=Thalassomonas haliotis TaxID=485448 RepID=A0ABY7VGX7_9GAMM|nr:response regulator [Thalassomonas haliotis]WDE12281.1 response regulator [Thalassomonas haliotis]